MIESLHTGGRAPPWEYVEVILCRDVYHCAPSVLDEQDPVRVLLHLEALAGEATARKIRPKRPTRFRR